MHECKRRSLAVTAALLVSMILAACAENTLRVAPHAALKNLDPIWTTAYVTRNHGYLVYDTLFAMDENFVPRPQMVDTWAVTEDQKMWTFKLRGGLKWHDGTDVTAEDCIASLQRWGKRDGMGQLLFSQVESLTAADTKTILMRLRAPYGLVLESLAKVSSNVPFMMPARIARTDPFTPIEDPIGSGPFIFKKDEWVPQAKAVYVRNPNYVPRAEPPSLAAGGKEAKLDRIEWVYFAEPATAVKALIDHEVDYLESPSTRFVRQLQTDRNVVVALTDPLGNVAMARFNHLQPPFNNVAIRRAVLMAIKQEDYMTAALGDSRFWQTCYSTFPCGTPLENNLGSEVMMTGSLAAAQRALQAAGYDGTPVVILNPTDSPVLSAFTSLTAETLRKMGMNVVVQDMDWATLLQRRASRAPVSEGGWSMFHTWWIAADVLDPTAIAFSGDPANGWAGWATDQELEKYRADFLRARTREERREIAAKVQGRLWAIAASAHLGQFFEPIAYRTNVKGITSLIQFYWTMSVE